MKSTISFSPRASAELSNQEAITLRKGTWRVDCSNMVIKSRASQNPTTVYGSGFIAQSSNGHFEFKLYSTREKNIQKGDFLDSITTGEVIPDQAYYDLSATDVKGRKWRAERLLPDFNRGTTRRLIIEGFLNGFMCQGHLPSTLRVKGSSLTFSVFSDVKIPTNVITKHRQSTARGRYRTLGSSRNAWKFKCCGIDFLLIKEADDLLTIRAHDASRNFLPFFEDRLAETLQFVLGRPIPWTIMSKRIGKSTTTILSSRRVAQGESRFLPPLPTQVIVEPQKGKLTTNHHRKLFECYLKHTLSFKRKRHPIWGQINAVYEAGLTSFIDAQALILTVAVESLLGSEFAYLGKTTKAYNKAVNNIKQYVDKWDGKEKIKARVQGSLNQLLQPRAQDRLRELVKLGAITDDQRKAWESLRNRSAHAYQISSLSSEKIRTLMQKVWVLFYHLIFYAIGYKGLYMDFSETNWPLKEYPPSGKRLGHKRV